MNTQFLTACLYLMLAQIAAADPTAKLTFKVVDDFGKPVAGAIVRMSSYDYSAKDPLGKGRTAATDTNGVATLTRKSRTQYVGIGILPQEGFYYTRSDDYWFKEVKNGKWQPWNPTVELVLKPILNPVVAYRNAATPTIPEVGKFIGFDLMAGDWVAPYGKGVTADFNFKFELKQPFQNPLEPFDAFLTLTFSNEDDGIQSVLAHPRIGSTLHMPRYAPEQGYESQLVRRLYREKGKPIQPEPKPDQNYFFRIRTVKKDGEIVSALYGKIHGDIGFDFFHSPTAIIVFGYSLNPEPNSRNMEFDPKQNLFQKPKAARK
ncbi:MAG: hypothetical protein ACK4UN_01480 [Limisphaerales bacterium]